MSDEYIKKEDILKFIENIKCNKDVPKNYGTLLDIMRYIRKMPTYDVDKVIEEIEDVITPTAEYRYKFCGTVEVGRCASYESCECCIAERMIEIVKSGGVSDD